ncbi:hypothetical protein NQ315_013099 [Exocentrus adspersus]|uniref:pyridoxal 5'-phosphate synthase n=1 Tax=Exocentrus adspersus TaxID=1586481 RepID=A0AAV8VWI6_9CUCU|nr:hypothetical protein NQ315_013099 [Exocentrus adspersus]
MLANKSCILQQLSQTVKWPLLTSFARKLCNRNFSHCIGENANTGGKYKISKRTTCIAMDESGLAYIDTDKNGNALKLLKDWMEEFKIFGKYSALVFNLATADRHGNVSNRNVVLRDIKDDYMVFATNNSSKKAQQIKDNPKVSACFLWSYVKDEKHINRQVRLEGSATAMSHEESLKYYEEEPLYCKIRSYICQQDKVVNWDNLKVEHDKLLKEVKENDKELPMPPCYAAYRIIPTSFDFYFAWDNNIADRVVFVKQSGNEWEFHHVAA